MTYKGLIKLDYLVQQAYFSILNFTLMNSKGTLIPIGGNENKGIGSNEKFHTENIEDSILSRVVAESGGPDAQIVLIPTASSIPEEVCANYKEAFGKLGCRNLEVADIRERDQAESNEFTSLIENAQCVMFSGGNQSEIINKIKDTHLHKVLLDKHHKGPMVIAGTSAGAMCMSDEMITGGRFKEAFIKGAVGMSKGMGFLPHVIIDSHFIRRGRFGRLTEAVAKYPHLIGIGLAENTGLIIKECNTVEVVGSGMVVIFDPRNIEHNNEKFVANGELMSLTNLTTHILAQGDVFNIQKHQVKILHVEPYASND